MDGTSVGRSVAIALTRAFTAFASPCCHAMTKARQSVASCRCLASSIPGTAFIGRSRAAAGSLAGSAPSNMMSPIETHGLSSDPSAGGMTRSEPSRNDGSFTANAPLMESISLAVRMRSPSIACNSVRTGGRLRIFSETRPLASNACRRSVSAGSARSAASEMRARTSRFLT